MSKSPKHLAVALMGCLTLASVFVAAYFAGQANGLQAQLESRADLVSDHNPMGLVMPTLDATAAVSSEKFSMATGLISATSEGLFVLDHNSGLLQCSVIYPRLGKVLGMFTCNVADALGTGKGTQYLMTTGLVDMPSSNNNPLASSVIYVLNATTGDYACYYIPFNRAMMNANKPQQGQIVLMATGTADPVIDRDNLR
ncbi:MAG: hypothetical protein AAF745_14475 [Planctomycetota bacterium]